MNPLPSELDDLNAHMWASLLQWAIGEPAFLERFAKETGLSFPKPPTNGIQAMIDAATGINREVAEQFMVWATCELWGLDYAPEAFQARVKELADAGKLPWRKAVA